MRRARLRISSRYRSGVLSAMGGQVQVSPRDSPRATFLGSDVDPRPLGSFSGQGETIMPKFMLIVGGADLDKRSSNNPAIAPMMLERYMAWVKSISEKGPVTSYKLYDQTGARLTVRGGQVVEGPFVEAKEAV